MTATKAAARAEKTKAELEEDARWARCNSCGMERRLRPVNDDGAPPGTMVWADHNMYVPTPGATPDQLPGEMQPCPGSSQPPQVQNAPPAVFADDAHSPAN